MKKEKKIRTVAEVKKAKAKNYPHPDGVTRHDRFKKWHAEKKKKQSIVTEKKAEANLALSPRPYQQKFFDAMMYDYNRAVLIWHRRAGKEIACWNFMIFKAVHDRVGTYVYFFPTSRLGRRILWDGANKDGKRFLDYIPPHLIKGKPNSVEMKVELTNGSVIQIVGTDSIINEVLTP